MTAQCDTRRMAETGTGSVRSTGSAVSATAEMRPTYRSYRDSEPYLRSSRICPVSGEPVFPLKLLERAA